MRAMRIYDGLPPSSSYWVGVSRDGLRALVASRKPQQAVPTEKDVMFDPAIAATHELKTRLAMLRAKAEARRRGL